MRCDCCPLRPLAEDDVCPESEGEYGIEHADGMSGCKHPYNWAKKCDEEYAEYLGDMGTDMGIEMTFTSEELDRVIEICKHTIGLDYKNPYHRSGKAFYKPYRNYYESPLSGNPLLDRLPQHVIKATKGSLSMWYKLTDSGLRWLGGRLDVMIKTATPYKECPHCGAHLDNGERCDCTENRNGDNSPKENKSCEGAKNNDRH